MVQFPNSKINLGLRIIRKRTDGYHDLETVFYPVAIKDAIEIIPAQETSFQISGLSVAGNTNDNICIKAYNLLKNDFPGLPAVNIYLHKAIPIGAGLGGGSADGAFMLMMLNKQFELNLSNQQLIYYALKLGSDCPFFILNKPCFATSRGENLIPVNVDLSAYKLVVVNPGIHVSTKEAFSKLVPAAPEKSIREIIEQPVSTWKEELINDFEENVLKQIPEIKQIKETLYNAGAVYASMTGSGSTVFGIFHSSTKLNLNFPENYFYKVLL